jgi:hypothetical protein
MPRENLARKIERIDIIFGLARPKLSLQVSKWVVTTFGFTFQFLINLKFRLKYETKLNGKVFEMAEK